MHNLISLYLFPGLRVVHQLNIKLFTLQVTSLTKSISFTKQLNVLKQKTKSIQLREYHSIYTKFYTFQIRSKTFLLKVRSNENYLSTNYYSPFINW